MELAGDPFDVAELLARRVHACRDLEDTLAAILGLAVEVCNGVDAAGVNLYVRRRFEPQAVFGVAPPVLDALQQRTGEGPCIEASRSQTAVAIQDTATDPRWPEFGELAVELGVRSVMCAPLWMNASSLGSLSLYSSSVQTPRAGVVRFASLLATQSALAIAGAQRSANLALAVDSRDLIGQAKGILMERHRVTADEAFELLQTSSQATNLKLTRIAEVLTSTGEVPVPVVVPGLSGRGRRR